MDFVAGASAITEAEAKGTVVTRPRFSGAGSPQHDFCVVDMARCHAALVCDHSPAIYNGQLRCITCNALLDNELYNAPTSMVTK